jgi:hypothetical protein
LAELGWNNVPGESAAVVERRNLARFTLGRVARDERALAWATDLTHEELKHRGSVDVDLVPPVLEMAARTGDATLLAKLLETYASRRDTARYEEISAYTHAIASFETDDCQARVFRYIQEGSMDQGQHVAMVLVDMLSAGEGQRKRAWKRLEESWSWLARHLTANDVMWLRMTANAFPKEEREAAAAFFTSHPGPGTDIPLPTEPSGTQTSDPVKRLGPALRDWLNGQETVRTAA